VTALGGLTLRGRCFAVAGVAALACAVVLGQKDLLRVAILLLALPVVCTAAVARTRHRVACIRSVDPGRVPAGEEARITLRLENVSLVPTGLLLAEDRLPRGMSARPRFLVDRLEPRGHRDVYYRVRSNVRGRYPVGPLTVRLADPFGMCELSRAFTESDELIVIPTVEALPPVLLGGEWTGSNDSHPSSIPAAGEDDIATREYRHGDALHRVHWRSTARRGELMVRREEQPRQSQATLLLDARASAHRGEGLYSSLEWAVSATASLGVHLNRRGYSLRVLTESGAGLVGTGGDMMSPVPDVEGLLLDSLAMLEPSRIAGLRDAGTSLARAGADGLLIAVLGDLSSADAEDLARRRQGTTTAVAILLRTSTWGLPPGAAAAPRLGDEQGDDGDTTFEQNLALLRGGGWRVIPVRSGDKLADVWGGAARGGGLPYFVAGGAA
jgi:uncharacterized protein (DUF58 family)